MKEIKVEEELITQTQKHSYKLSWWWDVKKKSCSEGGRDDKKYSLADEDVILSATGESRRT